LFLLFVHAAGMKTYVGGLWAQLFIHAS